MRTPRRKRDRHKKCETCLANGIEPMLALFKNCPRHADKKELERFLETVRTLSVHKKSNELLAQECYALLSYNTILLNESWDAVQRLAGLLNIKLPSK